MEERCKTSKPPLAREGTSAEKWASSHFKIEKPPLKPKVRIEKTSQGVSSSVGMFQIVMKNGFVYYVSYNDNSKVQLTYKCLQSLHATFPLYRTLCLNF